MQQSWVLYPMFVMVLLSILVGLRMLQLRIRAVKQDGLNPGYFLLNKGGKAPAYMIQAEQQYANLYETPVLFYLAVTLIYVLGVTTLLSVILAWAYVASRIAHALIHLGHNRLVQRRYVFLTSIAIMTSLWIFAFIKLVQR